MGTKESVLDAFMALSMWLSDLLDALLHWLFDDLLELADKHFHWRGGAGITLYEVTCSGCGKTFHEEDPYESLCWPCEKAQREASQ